MESPIGTLPLIQAIDTDQERDLQYLRRVGAGAEEGKGRGDQDAAAGCQKIASKGGSAQQVAQVVQQEERSG